MMRLYLPTVQTENLVLRPVQLSDSWDMYEYASDPQTLRFLSFNAHTSILDSENTIRKFFICRPDKGIPEAYAIVLKSNGKMIGTCDVHTITRYETGEIGYVLNRRYWGYGYMTEAVRKLIEVAFNYIGIRRLIVQHDVHNIASQKVIEKCGFIYEGQLRQAVSNNYGGYSDTKLYSLLRDDFTRMNLRR